MPRFRATRSLLLLKRWKGKLLFALLAIGLTVVTVWQYGRLAHITETDARVMADMVTMSSRIDGWIASRPVTDGQKVAAGQTLVVIDQREASLQIDELRAKGESIRLQQARTQTQLRIAETTAPSAVAAAEARRDGSRADLAAARSERERASQDYQRADALLGEQFVSRQTWDLRRSQLRQAEEKERSAAAQMAATETAVADAKANLGQIELLRQQLEGLTHDAEQVAAQLHQKEIDLADRVLRSPADAVIDQKFVEPGEYVIPGQRLVILHDPDAVWVEANVKETKLSDLKPGQPVEISVDAFPSRRFAGTIERIGHATTSQFALLPSPNPSGNFTKITQRVPVRIAVQQPPDAPLRPGMMVEVDIDTGHH
ncbi:HlyD family secretion protein [Telmatospirillum siberiense]|uniref:HlyD family secretion protein n=2 Tax=Telmatospirillum siberiense TaxID=382514 RepID=A0A2N3Q1Z2_9PROT|nr:HlyD family secretion protein [Telmatospirillum siberiense]